MGHIDGQARAGTDASLPVALPPGRTFAALILLIAVVSAAGLATRHPAGQPVRDETSPASTAPPAALTTVAAQPAPAKPTLSPEAAVRVFAWLRETLNEAVRRRDARGVAAAATPTGSVGPRAAEVVRSLRAEDVVDLTSIESLSVLPLRARRGVAVVRERARLRPCLQTDGGRDITRAPRAFVQTIVWRLRHFGGSWLLHRATIAHDHVLSDADARCP
jgi:hypothetical protein